jgi:hypothetical protein
MFTKNLFTKKRPTKNGLLFLLVSFLMASTLNAKERTLHLVIAGANRDPVIGKAVSANLILVESTFKYIAKSLHYTIQIKKFADNDFSRVPIARYLKDFTCDKDDAIVWYSCTHGYRFDDSPSVFPYLLIAHDAKRDFQGNHLAVENDIYYNFHKKAKLCLVLTEACNKSEGVETPITSRLVGLDNATDLLYKKLYERLFSESGGYIVASASKGFVAIGDSKGGYWTRALFQTLYEAGSKESNINATSWNSVFVRTRILTDSFCLRTGNIPHQPIFKKIY